MVLCLGGSLKNPLAIGAGVIEGSGLGINTMAAYVTRRYAVARTATTSDTQYHVIA